MTGRGKGYTGYNRLPMPIDIVGAARSRPRSPPRERIPLKNTFAQKAPRTTPFAGKAPRAPFAQNYAQKAPRTPFAGKAPRSRSRSPPRTPLRSRSRSPSPPLTPPFRVTERAVSAQRPLLKQAKQLRAQAAALEAQAAKPKPKTVRIVEPPAEPSRRVARQDLIVPDNPTRTYVNLMALTKVDLQIKLRELGLPVSGNKPVLVKRIQEYEAKGPAKRTKRSRGRAHAKKQQQQRPADAEDEEEQAAPRRKNMWVVAQACWNASKLSESWCIPLVGTQLYLDVKQIQWRLEEKYDPFNYAFMSSRTPAAKAVLKALEHYLPTKGQPITHEDLQAWDGTNPPGVAKPQFSDFPPKKVVA
jgi:hypothetical protein